MSRRKTLVSSGIGSGIRVIETRPGGERGLDRMLPLRKCVRQSAVLMAIVAWLVVRGTTPANAVEISPSATPLPAVYRFSVDDRSHFNIYDYTHDYAAVLPPLGVNNNVGLPPSVPSSFVLPSDHFGASGYSPLTSSRYFGSGFSTVVSGNQTVKADVAGVPTPYTTHPSAHETSSFPNSPTYSWVSLQEYSFVVNGPMGDNVWLTLTGNVSVSGFGSYFSAAEVAFLDGNIDTGTRTPILSVWSAGGVGSGVTSPETPFPSNVPHPFTLQSGSLDGAATILFQVPTNTNQHIFLGAWAYVYDQNGSTASALADPEIQISPLTPNAEQYSVSQSSNTTPVPEIDPRGFGTVLAVLVSVLGLGERRLRRC